MLGQFVVPRSESAVLSADRDLTAATPTHRRLAFLDAIRGIAAFAVLIQHLASDNSSRLEADSRYWFNLGQFGVVAFFLVSGFIIPVSLEKYGRLLPFWKARFFRLYPMYWVSLLLTLLLVLLHIFPAPANFASHPALDIVGNLTMLQRFVGLPDLAGVYWTLALEMAFYVLCSFVVLSHLRRSPIAVAVAVSLAVAVLNNVMAFGFHRSPPAMHLAMLISAFVGAVVYRFFHGEASTASLLALVTVAAVVIIQGFWLHYVLIPELDKPYVSLTAMVTAWVAGYALFFTLFLLRRHTFPKWLQWLGRISYSLYLLHLPLLALVPTNRVPLLWDPLAIILCLVVSHLTYRYIERPAMLFGR